MIGWKVQAKGRESEGFAEIDRYSNDKRTAFVRFYTGPTVWTEMELRVGSVLHEKPLPNQSRCFRQQGSGYVFGRVLVSADENAGCRVYWVQFPNASDPQLLREDEFRVMSYLDSFDAVATLACGGQETPFFAARRSSLLSALVHQTSLCVGLTGLTAAKIELLPHQVEVARRVLQDPTMRYLLADEVGLGKTIEAGIVLKQLSIDHPQVKCAVFAPRTLLAQWREELDCRFGLVSVVLAAIDDLPRWKQAMDGTPDVVVIDEAHRVVASGEENVTQGSLSESLRQLAMQVPHLLLLSATPILHREHELLELLHILDPNSHSLGDVDGFRRLVSMRQEIGRSLLALESVTMTSTARNQVRRVAQLLPQDTMVASLAEETERAAQSNDRAGVVNVARQLHLHLSETYRVHRRMLRTRRALLSEFALGAARKEETAEYELDDDRLRRLWEQLEEWRILAASHAFSLGPDERSAWLQAYFLFVEGISWDLKALRQRLSKRLTIAAPFERQPLERMLATLARPDRGKDRPSLLVEVLRRYNRRYGNEAKHVLFCSDSALCRSLADRIGQSLGAAAVTAVDDMLPVTECEERTRRFRSDPLCRVLVASRILEEGRNLQFVRGLILYDLPWAPMRLEQRIGRADRVDRTEDVPVKAILTIDDDDVAVDQVWYKLLVEGLGLFRSSLSDLQFLIDKEIPRLQQIAFHAGPVGLMGQIGNLKRLVEEERQQLAEQDVIDGLRMDAVETGPLWRNIQAAEAAGGQLASSFRAYLRDSVGMWVHCKDNGHEFSYSLHDHRDPIIPADRLIPLGRYANTVFTCHRPHAVSNADVQLLRPGHPVLQTMEWLLKWDPRGRAYAMWRRGPAIEPELVFRITAMVQADLAAIHSALDGLHYDGLSRQSLLRLIRSWFPAGLHEAFLDGNGQPAEQRWVKACLEPYDKDFDTNLGGDRAPALMQTFGGWNWPNLCRTAGDAALEVIGDSPAFRDQVSNALMAADSHFALLLGRLRARRLSGAADAEEAEQEQVSLRDLVAQALSSPALRIDSIGAYVFSEQPICPR